MNAAEGGMKTAAGAPNITGNGMKAAEDGKHAD